jgi:hypothetical protein
MLSGESVIPSQALRTRCHNPRCTAKLKKPIENPRDAFCCTVSPVSSLILPRSGSPPFPTTTRPPVANTVFLKRRELAAAQIFQRNNIRQLAPGKQERFPIYGRQPRGAITDMEHFRWRKARR